MQSDLAIIRLLLDKGANIESQGAYGKTALLGGGSLRVGECCLNEDLMRLHGGRN